MRKSRRSSSPAETNAPVASLRRNHLKPKGVSTSFPVQLLATRSMIDWRRCLADRGSFPIAALRKQIGDRGARKLIWIHQPRPAYDAVAVGIGVVGKGDVEPVAHPDQARHRKGEEQSIRILQSSPRS